MMCYKNNVALYAITGQRVTNTINVKVSEKFEYVYRLFQHLIYRNIVVLQIYA